MSFISRVSRTPKIKEYPLPEEGEPEGDKGQAGGGQSEEGSLGDELASPSDVQTHLEGGKARETKKVEEEEEDGEEGDTVEVPLS